MRLANEYHCRIIGPNCMGVYDPQSVDTMFLPAIGYFFVVSLSFQPCQAQFRPRWCVLAERSPGRDATERAGGSHE